METKKLKSIVDKAQDAVKSIEDESLKKIAFQKILDTLLSTNQAPPAPINNTSDAVKHKSPGEAPPLSDNINEFFAKKNPKSNPDMIVTVAYHFHYKGEGDFNVGDILTAYGKLLIPKPGNATDIINQNLRKGFISKVDKQKNSKQAYHITKFGIDYVNSNFTAKSKSTYKPKKKNKKDDGKKPEQ